MLRGSRERLLYWVYKGEIMKQTMFAQQKQGVKTDPRIKTFSWILILYWIFAAFQCFEAIVKVLTGYNSGNVPGQVSLGSLFNIWGLPILWTGLAILYVFVVRMWKRFDRKRQAAAQGDASLLANEQPLPDAQALSLPLTVRMRINRKWVIVLFIIAVFSFLLPFLAGLIFGSLADFSSNSSSIAPLVILISLGIGLFVTLLFVSIMLLVIYIKGREQITLTEHGILMVGVSPKTHSISWSEAKLFAIINPYRQPKQFKNRQPLMLELANEHEMIRWIWLPKTSIRWSFVQPMLPPEDYEQQMQNVLSVIAAKTGLPLYDLRKKQDLHYENTGNTP